MRKSISISTEQNRTKANNERIDKKMEQQCRHIFMENLQKNLIGFEIELKIDCMNDRCFSFFLSLLNGVQFLMRFKRNYVESSEISFSAILFHHFHCRSCLFAFHLARANIFSMCCWNCSWIEAVLESLKYVYFITYIFYCLLPSSVTDRNKTLNFAQYLPFPFQIAECQSVRLFVWAYMSVFK